MSDFERVWDECWTRVARGQATIGDCVRRYPEHAEALSRLFRVVGRLNQGQVVHPSAAFKTLARAAILDQIRARPEPLAQPRDAVLVRGSVLAFVFRTGLALAVVVFLVLASGTMLAQAALPGDMLYGWKAGSEEVFRAVYPDPLAADLMVMNRRANELTRVAGTPAAEQLAAEGYQQVLSDLTRHTDPYSESRIREQLTEQKTQLQRAGVSVPAIDQALKDWGAITPPPAGGTTGRTTTPAASKSPTTTQTPNAILTKPTTTQTASPTPTDRLTLTPTPSHNQQATSTQTRTPAGTTTPSRTPPATVTRSPTSNSQATDESTPPASSAETPTPIWTNTRTPTRTNTPTPTPCVSQSPLFSLSSAEACATPTEDCGTASAEPPPCGTLTRTGTPNPLESTTPARSGTPKQIPTENSGMASPSGSTSP